MRHVLIGLVSFCCTLFSVSYMAMAQDFTFLDQPIFEPAIDYADIKEIADCSEKKVRKLRYYKCRDSREIYEAALEVARANNQPLMMIFGFNTCPYCVVLEKMIFNPGNPMQGKHVARYLSKVEITDMTEAQKPLKLSVVNIHARSEHGLKLADELGLTEMAKAAGWHRVWSPFVVFVNPETGAMASESEWEAKEIYCDWPANIAVSLENIDMAVKGEPIMARKRCPKA